MKVKNVLKAGLALVALITVGVSYAEDINTGWQEYLPVRGSPSHQNGVASIHGNKSIGVCMISPSSQVTFYFNRAEDGKKPIFEKGSTHGMQAGNYGYEHNPNQYYTFTTTGPVKMKRISHDECRAYANQ